MGAALRTRIVQIGNSRGIRIPHLVLDRFGPADEVELEVRPGRLILRPLSHPRRGWAEKFRAMAARRDDAPLPTTAARLTEWDAKEWRW